MMKAKSGITPKIAAENTMSRYRHLFLISFLQVSVLLSSGGVLGFVLAVGGEGQTQPSSLSSSEVRLRDAALTSSTNSHPESRASRNNRTRYPAHNSGVVAQKLSPPDAAAVRVAAERDASLAYCSFCCSRPRGRAPPALA